MHLVVLRLGVRHRVVLLRDINEIRLVGRHGILEIFGHCVDLLVREALLLLLLEAVVLVRVREFAVLLLAFPENHARGSASGGDTVAIMNDAGRDLGTRHQKQLRLLCLDHLSSGLIPACQILLT